MNTCLEGSWAEFRPRAVIVEEVVFGKGLRLETFVFGSVAHGVAAVVFAFEGWAFRAECGGCECRD